MAPIRRTTRAASKGKPSLFSDETILCVEKTNITGSNHKRHRTKVSHSTQFDKPPVEPASTHNTQGVSGHKRRQRTPQQDDLKSESFPVRIESPWKVGAHVSGAGGIENTVLNAARIGANAFALFVKSQRKWTSPSLTEENILSFKARMKEFGYSPAHVLVHGSYLINMGNPDKDKRKKSYECFLDDLQRCEQLGLQLYNFHPGSTVGQTTKSNSMALIADCINQAHRATSNIIIVIENMAGAGNVIGSDLRELRDIIDHVENKDRIGVCLDTCHLYAAGYDITTQAGWDATLSEFEKTVGLAYLRGLHLNDARTTLGSRKDRHENIGLGPLVFAFRAALTDHRTRDLPLILETPSHGTEMDADGVWAAEINVLYRMAEHAAPSKELDVDVGRVEGHVDGRDLYSAEETDDPRMSVLVEEMRIAVAAAKGRGDDKSLRKGKRKKVRSFRGGDGDEGGVAIGYEKNDGDGVGTSQGA